MLKKKFRLSKVRKIKGSKSAACPFFTLKYLENELGLSRFAFVISKKVDKKAVIRNKAKRSLNKFLSENIEEIEKGYDFIFIVRKEIVGKTQKEIDAVLSDFLKKNKFLK